MMVSKKDRRHSGWVEPLPLISKQDLMGNDLFLEPFYDDWCDVRDGMRFPCDKSKLRSKHTFHSKHLKIPKFNKKLKKQNMIRRKRKEKHNFLKT